MEGHGLFRVCHLSVVNCMLLWENTAPMEKVFENIRIRNQVDVTPASVIDTIDAVLVNGIEIDVLN